MIIKNQIIKLKKNCGKGAALKKGVNKSKNNWILTSDIDISVSYSLDRGKLLNDNQGFLLVFYYKLTNLSSSQ